MTKQRKASSVAPRPRRGAGRLNEYGLTEKEERFVQLLLLHKSRAQAYREAYGCGPGPSSVDLSKRGQVVLERAPVRARLAALAGALQEEFKIEANDLLREAARIAYSDMGKVIDRQTARVLLPHELDEDTRAAVQSFEIDDMGRIKYKFWDKNSGLDRLFKFRGLFQVDNRQKADALAALFERLGGNVVGPVAAAAAFDDADTDGDGD